MANGLRMLSSEARGVLHSACALCRVDFIEKKIKTFLDVGLLSGNKKLLWVNPDCGLKTREWSQVGAAPSYWSVLECWINYVQCCHEGVHMTGLAPSQPPLQNNCETAKDAGGSFLLEVR